MGIANRHLPRMDQTSPLLVHKRELTVYQCICIHLTIILIRVHQILGVNLFLAAFTSTFFYSAQSLGHTSYLFQHIQQA